MTDRTASDWLAQFAAELGLAAPEPAVVDTLLDLAGVAAHSSERVAAPIACYLVGLAGADPAAAKAVADRISGTADG